MKIIQSLTLLLTFGTLLFLGSCAQDNVVTDDGFSEEENQVITQEPDAVDQRTVSGSFRSLAGVMDKLSCYCSNGGYITTEEGGTVAVCFSETVESCEKITVTGYRTSKSIESNDACPAGMMGFIKVQSYVVGETEY